MRKAEPIQERAMIADVLFEAREQILKYLEEFPEAYEGWEGSIAIVLQRMDALRKELDRPSDAQG
jgi:hypothetical protein